MNTPALPLLFVTLLIHGGCGTSKETRDHDAGGSFVLTGRMEFVSIETGCWVLLADDGKRYEPAGEKAVPLWKDGLTVTVRVTLLSGVASICQTGTIVHVEEILESSEP